MKSIAVSLMIPVVIIFSGCEPPVVNNVGPEEGYPGQIVALYGERLEGATVMWGSGVETVLQSYGSARYFQIPRGAAEGTYSVGAENGFGTSAKVDFTVKAPRGNWPAPRIEDIGIHRFSATPDGKANIWLAIPAANVDPDAVVTVCGNQVVQSIFYSALPSGYFNDHDPTSFGYPIYHYGLLLAYLDDQPLGASVSLKVTNTDGQTAERSYLLPSSADQLDSDNDGLPDSWETRGHETVDLPGMGCDPHRKDILVEVDWIREAGPPEKVWLDIDSIFMAAPVLNPDGTSGISIHVDHGQGGLFKSGGTILEGHCTIDFCTDDDPGHHDFYSYKEADFPEERMGMFHYGIVGRELFRGASGISNFIDDDFIITLSDAILAEDPTTRSAFVGTFVHELGHNLGLHHGGVHYDVVEGKYSPASMADGSGTRVALAASASVDEVIDLEETYKPNQASSMNYRYQLPGVSIGTDMIPDMVQTYSQGMEKPEDESTAAASGGSKDLNRDDDTADQHHDYDEWGNLILNFRTNQAWRTTDTSSCCTGTINVDSTRFISDTLGTPAFCDSIVVVVETLDGNTIGTSGCPKGTNACGYGEVRDIPCGLYRVYIRCGPDKYYWSDKNSNPLLPDTLGVADADSSVADTIAVGPSGLFTIDLIVVIVGQHPATPAASDCPNSGSFPDAFSDITPAPSNEVFRFVRVGKGPGIDIHSCSSPSVTVSDRSVVSGEEPGGIRGRFYTLGLEKIRFASESGTTVDFALPKDLLVTPVDTTSGKLEIRDRSSARGADKLYTISTPRGMFLTFVWKTSKDPIQLRKLGLTTRAPSIGRPRGRRIDAVDVSVGSQNIPRRTVTPVFANQRAYRVFVRSSSHQSTSPGREIQPEGYLLKAIVVGEKP